MNIAYKLNAIRTDNDTTITKLAEILDCSTKQIQRWERGQAEMGIYKLKKFCEYYQISADYILDIKY